MAGMKKSERALRDAILNLAIIKELNNQIEELKKQRDELIEKKKDEYREIFTLGFQSGLNMAKGKIEPDYTVEIENEDSCVERQERCVQENEIVVEEEKSNVAPNEKIDKDVDFSTMDTDSISPRCYNRVCKKSCIKYNSSEVRTLLMGTFDFPEDCDVPEGEAEFKKMVLFLGKKRTNDPLNKTARDLLKHLVNISNDVDPTAYILDNDLEEDQFLASVGIAANVVSQSTGGVAELQWYVPSTPDKGSDYVQFQDIRLRLVFVKRIYSVFERRLIDEEYRTIIDSIEGYVK